LKKDLPRNQPLLIKGNNQFVMPDGKGVVHLQPGEALRLVCPGKDNALAKLGVAEAPVTCAGGANMVVAPQKTLSLKELECSSLVQHAAKKNSKEKCEIPGNYQVRNIIIIALFAFIKHQRVQNHLSRSSHLQMNQIENIFTNF